MHLTILKEITVLQHRMVLLPIQRSDVASSLRDPVSFVQRQNWPRQTSSLRRVNHWINKLANNSRVYEAEAWTLTLS